MTRTLITYKGLKVPAPDVSNLGGLAIQNNFTKTVDWNPPSVWDRSADPGTSADINAGFYPGSRWLNTTTAKVWTCVDNTASAAVWQLGGSPAQTFVVNSQAAMLALDAHQGDLAVRTDLNETFILTTDDPTVLANWQELVSPGAVVSVNGYTGVVVLTKSDIGLSNVANSLQLIAADNLSDLTNAGTARTNLGLGTIATQDASSVTITGGTINGATVTGLPAPSAASDAATKSYVDATAQGLQVKPTAAAATTAALPTNTYNNGSSGVGATLTASSNGALTVDGYTVAVSDIVLVKNESAAANNGLYTVAQVGDGSHPYILTRHVDMDQAAEFPGAFVPVGNAGTANANSLWLANPSTPVTVGTTAIPFTQLNGATDLIAGAGITISSNTISVNTTQNITTLSNLTNNGLVTTSGGTGALSVTVPGTGILSWLATPSSANLASALTDKTGTGVNVFGTSPTFTTNITSPLVIGGTGTTSTLELRATSGVGATGALVKVTAGTNGGVTVAQFFNSGKANIASCGIDQTQASTTALVIGAPRTINSDDCIIDPRGTGTCGGQNTGIGSFLSFSSGAVNQNLFGNGATGTATAGQNGCIAIGKGSTAASGQVVMGASGTHQQFTDVYFGSGVVAASPADYTIHGSGASGANVAGAKLTLAGGIGTGTGVGGAVNLAYAAAGTSGSSANTLANFLVLDSTGLNLGTATTQKVGVYGVTPVAQATNTADLRAALVNFGIVAGGGATPLDLNGGALTAGGITNSALTSGRVVFSSTGGLATDDASLTYSSTTGLTQTTNHIFNTIGAGLSFKSGANARYGTGTLSGGTATISNTSVTANSFIIIINQGGTITNLGALAVTSQTAGTGFVVTSSNSLDASTFKYLIVETD